MTSFTTEAGCGRDFGVVEPCWELPPKVKAVGKRRIEKRGRERVNRAYGGLTPILDVCSSEIQQLQVAIGYRK
jgi:hypothetical protein